MTRRTVLSVPAGYAVEGDGFTTTDRTLAEQVAAELDRIDPLPCPGHEWVEITELGDPGRRLMCRRCSHTDDR